MDTPDDDLYKRNPARDVETFAVDVVRSWLTGRDTVLDLSKGPEPDFRIDYADGREARGEVTWHEDPVIRAMWSNVFKRDWHQVVELSPGVGLWTVKLRRGARIDRLYKELEDLLFALSASGREGLETSASGTWPRGPISDHARRLGITYLHRMSAGPDRAVYFLPSTGGIIPEDPDVIVDWIESVIAEPAYADVTNKLLAFDVPERHVFLMSGSATPFGVDARLQHLGSASPQRSPELPHGITHVWAVAQFGSGPVALWCKHGWQLVPLPTPSQVAEANRRTA